MESIKNIASKTWKWLNGKKFWLGLAGHAAWIAANIVFKDLTTEEQAAYGHLIIGQVTGVGLGHKGYKWYTKIKQNEK